MRELTKWQRLNVWALQGLSAVNVRLQRRIERITIGLVDEEPATFTLPLAPPMGSHVRGTDGEVYVRNAGGGVNLYGRWHWLDNGQVTNYYYGWGQLLDRVGPVTVLGLTQQEQVEAALYGPPWARWGDPDTPCPYAGCVFGTGHTGPHRDVDLAALGVTESDGAPAGHAAITPGQASLHPCTCGNPGRHRPGCERYDRLTGGEQ